MPSANATVPPSEVIRVDDDRRLAALIAGTDFVRRSPASVGGPGAHKEWEHFVVLAPGVDLLVNFSCCDDERPGAAPTDELPRLVLLARTDHWDGDVETFPAAASRIAGGRIDFTLGRNRLVFHDGVFEIDAALHERPIAVQLRLTPLTTPAFVPSVPMLDGPPLHWAVVPRLHTQGRLWMDGREYVLDGAPAYHDHNWGRFLWGHDVAWDWSFVLPVDAACPWCLTFVRLTDRARTRTLAQKLLLWEGDELRHVFREGEVEVELHEGFLRPPRVFKIPRAMALVAPEMATDVARGIRARATAATNWIECDFAANDVAQVLIPSESDLGATIFNEVIGRTQVRGCIDGRPVDFEGRSVVEVIRYV